jgi:oligopeptide transport system ATP-binding protein
MTDTPVLETIGLTKHFPVRRGMLRRQVGAVQAVSDVSMRVGAGETLALVGESGCGKSTTGRAALRLIEPSEGEVLLEGSSLTALSVPELRRARRQMQFIFQDPFGALNPRMSVAETLGEPMLLHGLASPGDVGDRVRDLLVTCGMQPFHAERFPHEFSGGQRQRIGVARALATQPKLVVCDEPVSALDVSVQAQLVNLLQDLQQQFGMAYVFISHDLAVVRHIAQRVAVMYLGRIVEEAEAATLFAQPRHPYTHLLLSAAPRPEPRRRAPGKVPESDVPSALNPPSGCAFHPRCPMAEARCLRERPEPRMVGGARVACHFAESAPAPVASPAARGREVLARRIAALETARAQGPSTV